MAELVTFATLTEAIFVRGEHTSLNVEKPGTPFRSFPGPAEKVGHGILPKDSHVWFGINPIRQGVDGRGKAADVTRWATIPADLDVGKDGALPTIAAAEAVIGMLSTIIGVEPSFVTHSGHGLQPLWLIDREDDEAHLDTPEKRQAAQELSRGFHRIIAKVAADHGAPSLDNVSDLARIMRAPGTNNVKTTPHLPVRTQRRAGRPLALHEIADAVEAYAPAPQAATAAPAGPIAPERAAELDGYSDDVLTKELARLNALRAAAVNGWTPNDAKGYKGESWNDTLTSVAYSLRTLTLSDWSSLTWQRACNDIREHMPLDEGMTADVVTEMLVRTEQNPEIKGRPVPPPRHDTWLQALPPEQAGAPPAPQAGNGRRNSLADGDIATRISIDILRAKYRWTLELGWLHFDGKRWAAASEVQVIEEVRLYIIDWHNTEAHDGADAKYLAALSKLLSTGRITGIARLTRGILKAEAIDFDTHLDLLNVNNGVLDLRTGQLKPHDPELLFRKMARANYVPGYTHPSWTKALEAVPDEVRPWIKGRFGQAITGYTPGDDRLAILQGDGENGKTSILEGVQMALGDYSRGISERVFTAGPNAHPTELMDLMGTRLAILEELPDTDRLPMDRIKRIVGKPTVTARYTGQDTVEFTASHTLFVTTNTRPTITETDHGSWRRLLLVVFPYRFRKPGEAIERATDKPGDPLLRPAIANDPMIHQAALTWLVEGAQEWYGAGRRLADPPASVEQDMEDWRQESDVILAFLTEMMAPSQGTHVLASDLLDAFNAWLTERGMHEWGERRFGPRLAAHELAKTFNIDKLRTRTPQDVSPRFPDFLTANQNPRSWWVGLRFQREDEAPPRWLAAV